jgi:alanine dehydrogenase
MKLSNVLLLSNDDVSKLLTMDLCLHALEKMYQEMASRFAVDRQRTDVIVPSISGDRHFVFKSMEGAARGSGVLALRINSDIIQWTPIGRFTRKDKIPLAGAEQWLGLVFLFELATGQLLSIFPDGVCQRMRVGATNGLGAKFMARSNSSRVGILGAGWQAGAQLAAMCRVRPITEIQVYSPTPDRRLRFAKEMQETLGCKVIAVDEPRAAVDSADIVVTATNAIERVFDPDWLVPGMHVTCVKWTEFGPSVFECCDVVVKHCSYWGPKNYIMGQSKPVEAQDPLELFVAEDSSHGGHRLQGEAPLGWEEAPELAEIIARGISCRESESQITCFINNMGLGVQFAALGAVIYEQARELGLGQEIPLNWFTQNVHP